ncbi:hypothetical protein SAMN02787142_7631 [Burkholderia sp. WP9]|nr:hypothetical protein SAMN02787142_7631 [Burkholderia sp. WP9]
MVQVGGNKEFVIPAGLRNLRKQTNPCLQASTSGLMLGRGLFARPV